MVRIWTKHNQICPKYGQNEVKIGLKKLSKCGNKRVKKWSEYEQNMIKYAQNGVKIWSRIGSNVIKMVKMFKCGQNVVKMWSNRVKMWSEYCQNMIKYAQTNVTVWSKYGSKLGQKCSIWSEAKFKIWKR